MARASKEAVVVVIDTSASMAEPYPITGLAAEEGPPPSKLDVAKELATLMLADRAVAEQGLKAKCEAGVVAFGTDGTLHSIQDLGDDYQHMVEVFPLEQLHAANLARTMALVPSETGVEGDMLSALILGFTMLHDRTRGLKVDRRMVILTDGCSRIGSAEGLDDVVNGMAEYGVRLQVVGFNFPTRVLERTDTGEDEGGGAGTGAGGMGMDPQRRMVVTDNARMLQSIVDNTHGAEAPEAELRAAMAEAREALAAWGRNLRKRAHSSNNNLDVLLTPRLAFNVQSAAITMLARPPSLKLSSREDVTHEKLVRETRYVDAQEGPASAEVAAHERVRGFQYGGELLPVDQAAEAALRWQEEEVAMRLITFLPRSKAKRWHALANALAIRPHHKDGTRRAAVLLASLAQALRDTDSVALVRFHRRKVGDPEVGILTPPAVRISPELGDVVKLEGEEMPPYLVYNKMPYQEDVRNYSFRPLDASNTRHYPKEEERAVALALVDALTLPTDRATGSALRLAPHPGIRAMWQAATAKAVAKGIEDEEAEAEDDNAAMDADADAEGAGATGASNNPLGRERVRAWGAALRAAQGAAEDRDGAREEDEGLPPPVTVPFLSFPTGQAAVEGEAALPKEMRRDPQLWGRAKRALKRFAEEFPLEAQEPKQKKQVKTWGDVGGGEYGAQATATAAVPTGAATGMATGGAEVKREEGDQLAATGLSLMMEEGPESAGEEEEEAGAMAGAAGEGEAAGAAPADATYAVEGKAVPQKVDRVNLEETLALMLGAGGPHTERALTQLKEMLQLFLKQAEEQGRVAYYRQARDALQAFRQASATAKRPAEEFNAFMREHVKRGLCKGGGAAGGDLWRLLQQAGITLRDVGEAEARAFLEEAGGVAPPPAPAPVAAPVAVDEDLIDFD